MLLVTAILCSNVAVAPPPVRADVELTVCASGCGYTSIQSAIDAAALGISLHDTSRSGANDQLS
ncbi:MAG: hypothetical protein ACYCZF_00705 [Anaerolineae bacterium]